MLNNLWSKRPFLRGHAHICSESRMRYPFARVPGGGFLEHAVDLLEGETLGLRDQEVGVNEADSAEGAPDEEDLRAEVAFGGADHVGGDDTDDL